MPTWMSVRWCLVLMVALPLAVTRSALIRAVGATYSITDIGTLPGGSTSFAYGINDTGQVVGWATTGTGDTHAFLYDGAIHDLGTLPGGTDSEAWGINALGYVVGDSSSHAFFYDGSMHDLGVLPGGNSSIAYSINDADVVVGVSNLNNGAPGHAFLYDGAMHDLGTLPGGTYSEARTINAAGHIAGVSQTGSSFYDHAFFYDGTMHDLGFLPTGNDSSAYGINKLDHVVGQSHVNSAYHGFFYDGTMHDVGTLPGSTDTHAYGINDTDQVVGEVDLNGPGPAAFLYDPINGIRDLNSLVPPDSGWVLNSAQGINDLGQIAGWGTINGHMHAFLLTPGTLTTTPTPTVPASGTATSTATTTPAATATNAATSTPTQTATPGARATVVVAPSSGTPLQTLSVTGRNFRANEVIKVYWDITTTAPLTTPRTIANGSFVTTLAVPQAKAGMHRIIAVGQQSHTTVTGTFQVKPAVYLNPTSGKAGALVKLIGVGFGSTEQVAALWYPGSRMLNAASSSIVGTVVISYTVPQTSTGTYYVLGVGLTSKVAAAKPFTVTAAAPSPPIGAPPVFKEASPSHDIASSTAASIPSRRRPRHPGVSG